MIQYDSFRVQELRRCILKYQTASVMSNIPALQPILKELSPWAMRKLRKQWSLCVEMDNSGVVESVIDKRGRGHMVSVGSSVYMVNSSSTPWTCECLFYKSHRLPCKHMMYIVAFKQKQCLSMKMVHPRWSMKTLYSLIPDLENAWEKCKQLHALGNPLMESRVQEQQKEVLCKQRVGSTTQPTGVVRRIRYVKLKKRKRIPDGSVAVKTKAEKYNIFNSLVEPVMRNVIDSGSGSFFRKLLLVEAHMKSLLSSLESIEEENVIEDVNENEVTEHVDVDEVRFGTPHEKADDIDSLSDEDDPIPVDSMSKQQCDPVEQCVQPFCRK